MKPIVALLLVSGILLGAPDRAGADPPKDEPTAAEDPIYANGLKAVKQRDWATAVRLFQTVVTRDDRNADAYNWLAYSTRQAGDAQRSIPIYQKALAIDPKHRGAHEYIGEAYLALGNLPKAKEHLAILDRLCLVPCEEHADLKKAVQAYEASGGRVKPTSKPSP